MTFPFLSVPCRVDLRSVIAAFTVHTHLHFITAHLRYSKPCLKRPLKKTTKIGFQDQLSLNAGQKYCRIQYFRPSLSYHLTLRPLFCLFFSGCLRQVLLYYERAKGSVRNASNRHACMFRTFYMYAIKL